MKRTFKDVKTTLQDIVKEAKEWDLTFTKGQLKRAAKILMEDKPPINSREKRSEAMKKVWQRWLKTGHPFMEKYYGKQQKEKVEYKNSAPKTRRSRRTFLSNSTRIWDEQ